MTLASFSASLKGVVNEKGNGLEGIIAES